MIKFTRIIKTKYILLIMMALSCALLTGCATRFSSAPSQKEVEEYLSEVTPTEELVCDTKVKDSGFPARTVYTYKSAERDLTIEVVSSVQSTNPKGNYLSGFEKGIWTDYPEAVRHLYYKDALDILKSSKLYTEGTVDIESKPYPLDYPRFIYVSEYSEVEEAVALISELNTLYRGELDYNNEEWLIHNPLVTLEIYWYSPELAEDGTYKYHELLAAVDINGSTSSEVYTNVITQGYIYRMDRDDIPYDESVPR